MAWASRWIAGWVTLVGCVIAVVLPSARAADEPKVAQRWALLVGVDDYAYAAKLTYCGADQRALRDQLLLSGFPENQVFLLEDKATDARQRPSHANIVRHLDLVLNLADAEDLIFIAFSGHGVHLDGKSFLCPGDCNLDDAKTLVSLDGVYDQLQKCAAQFKLVVVDACRNDPRPGGTRSLEATDGTRALARTLQEMKLPEGVVLLNSCAPGEVSWEDGEFGHGVFMHFLLDGLQGAADRGGDGHVSLNELQTYAGLSTKAYVAQRHRVAQRPFFKGDLSTEALEFALLPVAATGLARYNRYDKTKEAEYDFLHLVDDEPLVAFFLLPGGLAEAAGMQELDLIVEVGGKPVFTSQELTDALESYRPGDNVDFVVERQGRRHHLRIVPEAERAADFWEAPVKAAADKGSAMALCYLGLAYCFGEASLPQDDQKTESHWLQAAERGSPFAMLWLGRKYINGDGVAADRAKGLQWQERALAAAERVSRPLFRYIAAELSRAHEIQDLAEMTPQAWEYLEQAAAADDPIGLFYLAQRHFEGLGVDVDVAKAAEYLRRAADKHHSPAEFQLGAMYQVGAGVTKDLAAARGWFERAAQRGDQYAAVELGKMLRQGDGGPQDSARAVDLFRSAAEQKSPQATYELGACYRFGHGVAADFAQMRQWYQAAAELGLADAEFALGECLLQGIGAASDFETGIKHWEKAVELGSHAAMLELAQSYLAGRYVTKDPAKAADYLDRLSLDASAPMHLIGEAQYLVGTLILADEVYVKNEAEARKSFDAAAQNGNVKAMFKLGEMLAAGSGGPKDPQQAQTWYRKAAELGHAQAERKLQ